LAGSTYTWVKRGRLEVLAAKAYWEEEVPKFRGEIIERKVKEIEYDGERATCMIAFGEKRNVEADPITKKLRKTEALLAV
jgi:hypothetical protein